MPDDVSDSASSDFAFEILPPGQGADFGEPVNATVVEDEPKPKKDKAKAGPPRLEEWEDFFGRVLIKGITTRYVDYVFRDVDEELLTENELRRLHLSLDERQQIARPFAELSNKTDWMRKHGRLIIASSDAVESLFVLSLWFSRVNRIAAKYHPQMAEGRETHGHQRPHTENGSGAGPQYPEDFSSWDIPATG